MLGAEGGGIDGCVSWPYSARTLYSQNRRIIDEWIIAVKRKISLSINEIMGNGTISGGYWQRIVIDQLHLPTDEGAMQG